MSRCDDNTFLGLAERIEHRSMEFSNEDLRFGTTAEEYLALVAVVDDHFTRECQLLQRSCMSCVLAALALAVGKGVDTPFARFEGLEGEAALGIGPARARIEEVRACNADKASGYGRVVLIEQLARQQSSAS